MQKTKHIIFTISFFLIFLESVYSQNQNDLPNGYANIQLGMSVEETKEQFKEIAKDFRDESKYTRNERKKEKARLSDNS